MTGPEHYREAERWLAHAKSCYEDDSNDSAPREHYASDEEYFAAVSESLEADERTIREMAVFAALSQAHAMLARVAGVEDMDRPVDVSAQ